LGTPEDHEVDGQDAEEDLGIDGISAPTSQGGTQQTLEHAEIGLHLPSLAIGFRGPMPSQAASEKASRPMRRVFRWASSGGRHDPPNTEFGGQEQVMVFSVVSDIPEQDLETLASMGEASHVVELDVVRFGTPIDHGTKEKVCPDVHHGGQLGVGVLEMPSIGSTPFDVVRRNVSGFHAGGIDGGQWAGPGDQTASASEMDRCIQEPTRAPFFKSRPSA
jgi:hypothetical protein